MRWPCVPSPDQDKVTPHVAGHPADATHAPMTLHRALQRTCVDKCLADRLMQRRWSTQQSCSGASCSAYRPAAHWLLSLAAHCAHLPWLLQSHTRAHGSWTAADVLSHTRASCTAVAVLAFSWVPSIRRTSCRPIPIPAQRNGIVQASTPLATGSSGIPYASSSSLDGRKSSGWRICKPRDMRVTSLQRSRRHNRVAQAASAGEA